MKPSTGVDAPNHTQIPNDILGDILTGNVVSPGLMAKLEGSQLKVLLAVCRLTLGYHQLQRRASLTMLQKLTGLSRPGVSKAAQKLEKMGLIERLQDGGVTLWQIVVNSVNQEEGSEVVNSVNQVVNSVNQPVNSVNQIGKLSLPPSKKETRNKPKKKKVDKPKQTQTSENLTIPENDFTTLHAVFLDESQKPAPSRVELKSWRPFYADIYHAAGCDVNMASEAIRVAIRIADGDNDQKKRYPINDPGSITKTATNWIAEYKRDKRREAEVNASITDLPPPEPEPERTPEEKIFDQFQELAALFIQPAQFYNQWLKGAEFLGKPNGKLQIGVNEKAKEILDHRHRRTIQRICDSIPSIEGIEFVAVS